MWHVWGKGEVCTKVLVGKPEGKRPLARPRLRWEDNIKMDLQEVGRGLGTGWSWLRIGTGGGRLWVRQWTFGFHKMRGISWLTAKPVIFWRRTLLHGISKYLSRWGHNRTYSVLPRTAIKISIVSNTKFHENPFSVRDLSWANWHGDQNVGTV